MKYLIFLFLLIGCSTKHRYKEGDIVYIKTDSIKCIITATCGRGYWVDYKDYTGRIRTELLHEYEVY